MATAGTGTTIEATDVALMDDLPEATLYYPAVAANPPNRTSF
jgi:hypothetical protein